jgi:hypothetical protein
VAKGLVGLRCQFTRNFKAVDLHRSVSGDCTIARLLADDPDRPGLWSDGAHWPRVPKRCHGVRAVPGAGGREGIGFSYIISTGNEADLDFTDFARYLLDDPDTRVIAGFVEGFKRADKFLEVAKLAAERGKPIVLIKIGRSELGARAALSHTAALTGADAWYDAIFAQYGVSGSRTTTNSYR